MRGLLCKSHLKTNPWLKNHKAVYLQYMVFSSIPFLIYVLPVFLLLYTLCPQRYKNSVLLISSIFIYSWGGPKFIGLILITTFLDFYLVKKMHASRQTKSSRGWLYLSLSLNLGLLLYFKYMNFFIDSFCKLTGMDAPLMSIALPIGISFYTFESLTYVLDVYRGEQKPLQNPWTYLTYILFFPKLIAGPIVRFKDMGQQLINRPSGLQPGLQISGFWLFALGLAKKTILANTLGQQVDAIYHLPASDLNTAAAWTGAITYTFQIYFDFSGYSDMAIGLGRMMGFRIADNFNNPYTAISITDFWKRWHISLSTWMRHYLYIPLGGNQKGTLRTYLNLSIVFLISGLWHGAGLNFIVWGAYHGFFLIIERLFMGRLLKALPQWIGTVYMFLGVTLGWIFFRSDALGEAWIHLKACFSWNLTNGSFALQNETLCFLLLSAVFSFWSLHPRLYKIQNLFFTEFKNPTYFAAYAVVGIVLYYISLTFLSALHFNPFIYFRF